MQQTENINDQSEDSFLKRFLLKYPHAPFILVLTLLVPLNLGIKLPFMVKLACLTALQVSLQIFSLFITKPFKTIEELWALFRRITISLVVFLLLLCALLIYNVL